MVDPASTGRCLPRRRASCWPRRIKWRWCLAAERRSRVNRSLPVFEELNGLLFHPGAVRREEMSPRRLPMPARRLTSRLSRRWNTLLTDAGGAKRFFLLGTDYVYPRTTSRSSRAFTMPKGSRTKISRRSTPRSATAITRPSSPISKNSPPVAKRQWSPPSMAIPTYRSTKSWLTQGLKATDGGGGLLGGEEELRSIDTKPLVGNLAAWNYFESVDNPTNKSLRRRLSARMPKAHKLRMPIRW